MRSRASGEEACLATSSSKVRLVSSIMTVSEPDTRSPASAKRAGSMRCASVFISESPRLSARRRAGSMVRHSVRLPAMAAPSPKAAAVVVLPTPPQPTQRITRRESMSGPSDTALALARRCWAANGNLARSLDIGQASFSMQTQASTSSDRRQRRSDDLMTALHYQLAFARHEGEFDALILADASTGVLVAGAGAWPTCEMLAAYAPLVAGGPERPPVSSESLGEGADGLVTRSLSIDGSEVLLCGRGGGSKIASSLARAASG